MDTAASPKTGRDWLTKSAEIFAAVALLIFLAASLGVPSRGKSVSVGNVSPLVASNAVFGLDLFAQIRHREGNLIFSPHSVSTCLAMTLAGARGTTEQQMIKALHFDTNKIHAAFGELQKQLRTVPKGTELNITNGLWAQSGHPFLPAFLSVVEKEYEANVNKADFHHASAVASDINSWVSDKTKGRITQAVRRNSLMNTADWFWSMPSTSKARGRQSLTRARQRSGISI